MAAHDTAHTANVCIHVGEGSQQTVIALCATVAAIRQRSIGCVSGAQLQTLLGAALPRDRLQLGSSLLDTLAAFAAWSEAATLL